MVATLPGAVINPIRTQSLAVSPPTNSRQNLIALKGPGSFISAEIIKQGGDTNLTVIMLDIDDKKVVSISVAALISSELTTHNAYGISVLRGDARETITIEFPYLLTFRHSLKLAVQVNEPGVVQLAGCVLSAGC